MRIPTGERPMTVLMDFQDRAIRLTEERQQHIAQRDDPDEWLSAIKDTLREPDETEEAFHHPELRLYYRIYTRNLGDDLKFHVVVKVRGYDMLIVTALFGRGLNWGN